jgi:osmotically-inducible protein OsmY
MRQRSTIPCILAITLVALAGGLAGCRSASTATPDEIDPEVIEAAVRSQIASQYPDETFDLGVDVSEAGVVTLSGDVDTVEQRSQIGDLAANVDGVTRVVNQLRVE